MIDRLAEIKKLLLLNSDLKRKASSEKFVPGAQKVYGVSMPLLNEMAAQFKDGGFGLVEKLWNSGAFEEKVLAAKILRKMCRANPDYSLKLLTGFSSGIKNWAECDALGMQSLKPITKLKQREIFSIAKKLSKSKNPWKRRLSLVLLENYTKDKLLKNEITALVKSLENDNEYYVQKAVIWLKRNFEKGR